MKILKNILFWVSTVFLVLAIVLIAVPKVFGVEFRAVVTGSMEPEIPVGSLVVIVPAKAENIKIGDDISFVTGGEKVVTHRVIEIDRETGEFITKGIANSANAVDAPNRYENILGVVKLHVPKLGLVFSWIATKQGKIIAATVILAIYLLSCILSIWTKGMKKEKEKIESDDSSDDLSTLDSLMQSFEESEKMFEETLGKEDKSDDDLTKILGQEGWNERES